ncbi:phasin family protein [Azonexus hydrophilus]|jgi:phasin family protein|uniref:Phasin family protein n=1 Tax=Azonexus hydrophilus TaxID=418702 RepID=A0ABZ2XDB0_9RHOO|nr:phasin family protein [Azonexus hydrophilus]MBS4017419.1 phasin family protein [Dechloromonas sp.]
MLNAEKVVSAHKAQLAALHEMTGKALDVVEKIAQLNLDTARNHLQAHDEHVKTLMSAKDLKSLAKLNEELLQKIAGKTANYSQELFKLASGMGSEFGELVQSQMKDAQKEFFSAVEVTVNSLPENAASVKDAIKSAMAQAATAMESVQKAVQEAQDTGSAQLSSMVEGTTKSAKSRKSTA